jgi:hypothetical protein
VDGYLDSSTAINAVDKPSDFGKGEEGEYRRWAVELSLAKTRMKPWREKARKLWDIYHGTSVSRKKNSYNALYANTEILAPSVYNSMPTPDVRRRFAQGDALGKAVSEVLNRALLFNAETTGFEAEIKDDILDMLIPGMGFSRVRYVPDLVEVGDTKHVGSEEAETNDAHEAQQGEENEELAWETAPIEHVKWDKYLHGPGRTFKEIPWWAFEHDLTREELIRRFGDEIGNAIELSGGPANVDADIQRIADDDTMALFKTAKVWEIWDKETRRVNWFAEGYKAKLCKIEKDPLKLEQFFPLPDPLRAIDDSDEFTPTPLYDQYKEQAEELDRISTRINKLVDALKARAIYDPSLGDMIAELFRGQDNDLIPAASSIKGLYENGGLANAIWFAPIEAIIKVIEGLYEQREQCKQVIYELTGIADIMRGSTDAQETKGAQDLKVAFGMTRLSRMQRSVQRYIRDLLCLQAEVICNRFALDTLQQMTQLSLPTDAQLMASPVFRQWMMTAVAAIQQGQTPPPKPPNPVSWEDVHRAMQNDAQRTFRVDIETDSTIAAAQQEDAQDLATVMTAIVTMFKEMGPAVQMGVLPFGAFKELLLMTARKFRMGTAVEDALDQMQPPKQPGPPVQVQVEQMRQQGKQQEIAADVQAEQHKAQIQAWLQMMEQRAQAAQAQQENSLEAQRSALQAHYDAQVEALKAQQAASVEAIKTQINGQLQIILQAMKNQSALEVAEITTGAQLQAAQISAAQAGSEKGGE